MKMLMFDFRESEAEFFQKNDLKDFEIEFINEPLNENTVLTETQMDETSVISVFVTSDINKNVIKKFKNLIAISTRSTGYNHIDLKYCKKNNIAVFNIEQYGEHSVAQYTFMLILTLIRKLIPAYTDLQKNIISYECYEGRNLEDMSIGLIGCGSIGSSVAKIANFFGMKVYICCLEKNKSITNFVEYLPLNELLEKADIISLHIPFNDSTYHIINEDTLSKMKEGALIINTSRGELVDTIALYNRIISGKIAGAALDVIECEKYTLNDIPISDETNDKICHSKAYAIQKLKSLSNVIITPHIAYNTKESINTILKTTFNSLRDFSKGLHTNQLR